MHSNRRMLEWGGFPGDTGTCRIAWISWNCHDDWNVWNVSGMSGMSGMSGKTGMSGVPLEGLVAGMPGMFLEGLVGHTDGFPRRSPCLLCVEFLFWNEGLFALCM